MVGRNVDAEYKILNNIAEKLKNNPKAFGKVTLFVELEPCTSCQSAIDQFRAKFPNIELDIHHNNDERLIPKKEN